MGENTCFPLFLASEKPTPDRMNRFVDLLYEAGKELASEVCLVSLRSEIKSRTFTESYTW